METSHEIDRELSLELGDESPVKPAGLHMCTPAKNGSDSFYYLEINGEVLWEWRMLKGNEESIFSVLQENLRRIGFQLHSSASNRIGRLLAVKIRQFYRSVTSASTSSNDRKKIRSTYWKRLALHPGDVDKLPSDYLDESDKSDSDVSLLQDRCAALYNELAELKKREKPHRGKPFEEVGNRQQQRHLSEMRSRTEKALSFAESFGLVPVSLDVEVQSGGQRLKIEILRSNQSEPSAVQNATPEQTVFNQQNSSSDPAVLSDPATDSMPMSAEENTRDPAVLSDPATASMPMSAEENTHAQKECFENLGIEEQEEVKNLLYILDRFSISMQGYHELTQVDASLPKTHLLESCIKVMDGKWNISRTPGTHEGTELPIKHLLEREIRAYLKTVSDKPDRIKVKISGDGTRMSHSSNVFVCSFALLEDEQKCLSSAGNHTIAVVKATEDHNTLKVCLANVIKDINELISEGHLFVDGEKFMLDFYLGGDYKFLLLAMGMKAATSNNSCIWCKIHKNDRCNMSYTPDHFQQTEMVRSVDDNWSKQPGCRSQPFYSIATKNAVIDELHMMLRITDRLEDGLIKDIIQWDEEDNINKPAGQQTWAHLNHLQAVIKSMGISLKVSRVGDKWEWTSLLGGEKRLLLRKLPAKFDELLPQGRVQSTKSLWVNFGAIMDMISKDEWDDDRLKLFEEKALAWGKEMVAMSGTGPGYKHSIIITPYMHILVYHVPMMLKIHGSLKIFSGQGVEKKNDDFRRYFHRKINRWDACANLLLVEKRQEELREYQRVKRCYTKRKTEFWDGGGKQEVAKKIQRISRTPITEPEPPTTVLPDTQIHTLTDLKKMKVKELLALLQQKTGNLVARPAMRKHDLIAALMTPVPKMD